MWCALVDSLVPDLCSRGAEIVRRMQDLARRLIYKWTGDEVVKIVQIEWRSILDDIRLKSISP